MGTHKNAVQRAKICFIAMVGALMNGAFDALVGMTVHDLFLLPVVWP